MEIVIILRNDLLIWQKLNVATFLMNGISGTQNIIGEPYVDGNDVTYLPMSQKPVMICSANGEQIKNLLNKAINKDLQMTTYTEKIFKTYNDEDNRAKVIEYTTNALNLVAIGMIGKKNHIDRLTKGLSLHA